MAVLGELKSGAPVSLGACGVQAKEKFTMTNDTIRLVDNPGMCINSKGGVYQGAEMATYPCSASDNEQFVLGKDGRIRAKATKDNLCLNIKENDIKRGTGLALYECGKEESYRHDVFGFEHHAIFVKSNPKLRLHAQDLTEPSNLMLGGCDHDTFDFNSKTKQIQLRHTDLCINAEGGVGTGTPLIMWQCTEKGKEIHENEKFEYDQEHGTIISLKDRTLSFNAKEADVVAGTPIVLFPTV